mmetsp:Transcript_10771/g.27734  ORF Transcript_10771/g.27734 Transcript_10771/m.27734 type:complete len:293 (-) Transcript_10771:665-1543(-)
MDRCRCQCIRQPCSALLVSAANSKKCPGGASGPPRAPPASRRAAPSCGASFRRARTGGRTGNRCRLRSRPCARRRTACRRPTCGGPIRGWGAPESRASACRPAPRRPQHLLRRRLPATATPQTPSAAPGARRRRPRCRGRRPLRRRRRARSWARPRPSRRRTRTAAPPPPDAAHRATPRWWSRTPPRCPRRSGPRRSRSRRPRSRRRGLGSPWRTRRPREPLVGCCGGRPGAAGQARARPRGGRRSAAGRSGPGTARGRGAPRRPRGRAYAAPLRGGPSCRGAWTWRCRWAC